MRSEWNCEPAGVVTRHPAEFHLDWAQERLCSLGIMTRSLVPS